MSMANMGKVIPSACKQSAYELVKEWGVDAEKANALISKMSEYLERDKPFEAMESTKGVIDLTGAYRVMAVLLTFGDNE